jgi:hypothetical protein
MRVAFKQSAAALAVAFGLVTGALPAAAQAPAPSQASPEQVQLGIQFADQLLNIIDLDALLAKEMTNTFAGSNGEIFKIEPRWRDFFLEGMSEEFKADHAAIITILGRAFAKNFTADEMKAGILVFRDPVMPRVVRALMAGQPAPTDAKLQTATLQAMGTPAGQSFLAKFSNIGPIMDGAKNDFIRVLIPGFFQRFGDKAMALERQRRQVEGLPGVGG